MRVDALRPNRSIPAVVIIPELAYSDVPAAAEWLCRAFGFEEHLRIADHRIQLLYGDAAMVVMDLLHGEHLSTERTHSLLVRVEDADRHHDQAVRAGARIVDPPTNQPFGERQYTTLDLGGHRWTFSQTIADSDPRSWGGTPA